MYNRYQQTIYLVLVLRALTIAQNVRFFFFRGPMPFFRHLNKMKINLSFAKGINHVKYKNKYLN